MHQTYTAVYTGAVQTPQMHTRKSREGVNTMGNYVSYALLYYSKGNYCGSRWYVVTSFQKRWGFTVLTCQSVEKMYIAFTSRSTKDRILELFTKPDGEIRFLIAAIALGLGVNTPNIPCSIPWGCSDSINAYVHAKSRKVHVDTMGNYLMPFHTTQTGNYRESRWYVFVSFRNLGMNLSIC